MRKGILLSLDDEELQELYRIMVDDDQVAALQFLKRYLRQPVHEALEGG